MLYYLGSVKRTLTKIIFNTDSITTKSIKYSEDISGVNFYGNKIFLEDGVYELLDDLSIGKKLNSFDFTLDVFNQMVKPLNDKFYALYDSYSQIPRVHLYTFDEDTNTLELVETISNIGSNSMYQTYQPNIFTAKSIYVFAPGDTLIGYKIDGQNIYLNQNRSLSTDKILSGYTSYSQDGSPISGTMPNNGDVTIAPTTSEQVKEKGYYNSLKVSAVTSAIDSNITPENIKSGVSVLGVEGTLEGGIDTSDANATASDIAIDKTAYVNGQKITGVIPEYKSNTELGEQYFIASKFDKTGDGSGLLISGRNSADGLFRTGTYLGVNIGTEEQSQLAELIGLTADKISEGNTILGVEGTAGAGGIDTSDATATVKDILAGKTAYVDGEKLEGTMANNGDLIVTPNTDEQDHSAGYYNSVQVRPVTSSVDTNIKAENIKSGISILGVAGSVIELNGHELEVTPSTEQKVIEPEENYNAITRVTVKAVTSSIDPNITPENIKSGVSILGVTGTYNGEVLLVNQVPTSTPDKLTYAVVVGDGGNYLGTYKYDPSSDSGGTWEKLVETV